MIEAAIKHFEAKKVTGVEIGVYEGDNALDMLRNWKEIEKLYLVDSYTPYLEYLNKESHNKRLNKVVRIITGIPKVSLIVDYSVEASKQFDNGTFDFCYIDGNHAYKSIKEDILAWLPKVKKGGIIGGHDYDYTDYKDEYLSVKRAVDEIFGDRVKSLINVYEMNEKENMARLDGDWWVFI